jgi:hypothetical protein
MGIPTASPATIGKCHSLLVLLNLKKEFILIIQKIRFGLLLLYEK